MITVSEKICHARMTNAGAWAFDEIDIQQDLMPASIQSTMHLKADSHEYRHLARTAHEHQIALTCCCPNPIRPNLIFCGDNKGYIHVIDVQRGTKENSYPVSKEMEVRHLSTNGLYTLVVTYADGSVTVNDAQNDFTQLLQIEKPIKRENVALSDETSSCLKTIVLPDKNSLKATSTLASYIS